MYRREDGLSRRDFLELSGGVALATVGGLACAFMARVVSAPPAASVPSSKTPRERNRVSSDGPLASETL